MSMVRSYAASHQDLEFRTPILAIQLTRRSIRTAPSGSAATASPVGRRRSISSPTGTAGPAQCLARVLRTQPASEDSGPLERVHRGRHLDQQGMVDVRGLIS